MSAVATIRSQLSTSSHAPPQTSPPTSAMVAIGSRRKYSRNPSNGFAHVCSVTSDGISLMSWPLDQVPFTGSARKITTRTPSMTASVSKARASSSMGVVSRLRLSGSQNVIRITAPSVRHVHSLTITESRGRRGQATQAEQQAALHIKELAIRAEVEAWSHYRG